MNAISIIEQKLNNALAPSRLIVRDESHLHQGHAGSRPGGETHFRLLVVSERFEGLTRVRRQRLVNEALREEMRHKIHALAMQTLTPLEYRKMKGDEPIDDLTISDE